MLTGSLRWFLLAYNKRNELTCSKLQQSSFPTAFLPLYHCSFPFLSQEIWILVSVKATQGAMGIYTYFVIQVMNTY
jgi:hypothetical protein